ncbi:C-C chemokine receptor type 6 [Dunckerocampus dactyliophorus]|uniref:C-C chemokine receptor type 6 n=1 Tax=Dunckerocampus dactyliophorus TaxID=161453 RepID=UPI002406FBC3|nr:C-C chemokine receptor type 6 [Dunckerocampus dactyliophorus]
MSTETPSYDYYYNGTEDDPDDGLCNLDPNPVEVTIQTSMHSLICAFGLVGNILVVVTYIFYKRSKTMTDIYLVNVAVADLTFVLALPFIIYNEQHSWIMGAVVCKVLKSAYSINLYSGMLLLACISGDRYVAIVQARRSFGTRSSSLIYSRVICCVVWVCAAALTVPTLIYTERFEETSVGAEAVSVVCQLSFSTDETAKLIKVLIPSLQMAIGFLLPLLVMMFCYSCIMCTLIRAQSSQRHKAIRVVLVVVVVFITCHLPYNVALLNHTLSLFTIRGCKGEMLKLQVLAISKNVAYLHCCLNPILYAFIGSKFRSHFRQIAMDLWCFGKKYINSARYSRGTSDTCISGFKSSDRSNNLSSFSA